MNQPSSSYAIAFGLPINEAIRQLEQTAKEMTDASGNAPAKPDSFGQRIAKAVKAKMPARHASNTPTDEPDESFGRKLANAVKDKVANRRCSLLRPAA